MACAEAGDGVAPSATDLDDLRATLERVNDATFAEHSDVAYHALAAAMHAAHACARHPGARAHHADRGQPVPRNRGQRAGSGEVGEAPGAHQRIYALLAQQARILAQALAIELSHGAHDR